MTVQQEIELGRLAKVVLTNPAYEKAYSLYRDKIVEQIQAADPLNVDLVMTLKRHLSSLSIVRKNMEILLSDGEIAKLNFERQTLADRAKAAFRRVA
jgi:hypothetical protein